MVYEDFDFNDVEELSDEQVEELRQKLVDLEVELGESIRSTDDSAKTVELDQACIGRLSRIDAIQQQQMSKAYRQRSKIRLQQVRASLDSIERGDFGICNVCEDPISYKRLSARPESPICMRCQSERENS